MNGDEVLIYKDNSFCPTKVINVSNLTLRGKYRYLIVLFSAVYLLNCITQPV